MNPVVDQNAAFIRHRLFAPLPSASCGAYYNSLFRGVVRPYMHDISAQATPFDLLYYKGQAKSRQRIRNLLRRSAAKPATSGFRR